MKSLKHESLCLYRKMSLHKELKTSHFVLNLEYSPTTPNIKACTRVK